MVSADVLFDEDFETMAVGTLADTTHPGWTGMIEGNQAGQPITDWKIVEGAGLDWVAADGGMISGGNRHFEMKSLSNITGRAFRDLDPALPTDIGEPTSIYLRYCVSFDRFENIANPDDDTSVWPLVRFNGSWQMRSIVKFRHRITMPETMNFGSLRNYMMTLTKLPGQQRMPSWKTSLVSPSR
jgi:hypothetical protein